MEIIMQIQHTTDTTDTYAHVGAKTTNSSFGISDSAAFYMLLSKALYQNPAEAARRETICNAWDSHIASLMTDTAIDITLTDSVFIVRDYGKGIPHDKFDSIALSYGDSTKKESIDETGGFGLGFKSPFAYGPTFNTINNNAGIRAVYEMISAEISDNGKPQARPIITVPTDETGVEISFPIQKADYTAFKLSILKICAFGGIKANLNGVPISRLDPADSPYGVTILSGPAFGVALPDDYVQIRYGTVLYPIPDEITEYNFGYNKGLSNKKPVFETKLEELKYDCAMAYDRIICNRINSSNRFIITADSGTLTIMPSREALAISEHNYTQLLLLLNKALNFLDQAWRYKETNTERNAVFDKAYADVQAMKLDPVDRWMEFHRLTNAVKTANVIHKPTQLAHRSYFLHSNNRADIHKYFFSKEEETGYLRPDKKIKGFYSVYDLMKRHYKKLYAIGIRKSFFSVMSTSSIAYSTSKKAISTHSVISKIVVVASLVGDAKADSEAFDELDIDRNLNMHNYLVYRIIGKDKSEHKEAIIAYFREQGFIVYDVTDYRDNIRKENAILASQTRELNKTRKKSEPAEPELKRYSAIALPDLDFVRDIQKHNYYTRTSAIEMTSNMPYTDYPYTQNFNMLSKFDNRILPEGLWNTQDDMTKKFIQMLMAKDKVLLVNTRPRLDTLLKAGKLLWMDKLIPDFTALLSNDSIASLLRAIHKGRGSNRIFNLTFLLGTNTAVFNKYIKNSPFDQERTAIMIGMWLKKGQWVVSDHDAQAELEKLANRTIRSIKAMPEFDSGNAIDWYNNSAQVTSMPEEPLKHFISILSSKKG